MKSPQDILWELEAGELSLENALKECPPEILEEYDSKKRPDSSSWNDGHDAIAAVNHASNRGLLVFLLTTRQITPQQPTHVTNDMLLRWVLQALDHEARGELEMQEIASSESAENLRRVLAESLYNAIDEARRRLEAGDGGPWM